MKSINKFLRRKGGFTLLEIIIVIIIIGVLASLAMPRFFRTIEYSKGQEALTALAVIRQSMNRCYLMGNTYVDCEITTLDIDNPGSLAGARFSYALSGVAATAFTVTATRTSADGGTAGSGTISINQDGVKSGTGFFIGIR